MSSHSKLVLEVYLGYLGKSSVVDNCVMFSNFIKNPLDFLKNFLLCCFKEIKCIPSSVVNIVDDFIFQNSGPLYQFSYPNLLLRGLQNGFKNMM